MGCLRDRRLGFSFRSVEVEHIPVDALKRIVEGGLRLLYGNDPDRVMDVIVNFCEQHIHETLTAPQVSAHLKSEGLAEAPDRWTTRDIIAGPAQIT